jgi:hypothetical protein
LYGSGYGAKGIIDNVLWLAEGGQYTMNEAWEEKLSCAVACARCKKKLGAQEQRILSVYDDEPICLDCKKKEEGRSD